jgi:hypothetical protein
MHKGNFQHPGGNIRGSCCLRQFSLCDEGTWQAFDGDPPPPQTAFVVPYHCTTLAVANKHPGIIGKDCMLIFYDCHQLVMCILFCCHCIKRSDVFFDYPFCGLYIW